MLGKHGAFFLACLVALGALGAAYSNHFDNGFHFDDFHVIQTNLAIRSLNNAPRFFTEAETFTARPQNAVYRPVLTLSFALDYWAAGGLEPRRFHVTQFALLLALGAILVPFLERLCDLGEPTPWNRWIALFAATLFCIHTANTETVNYLSSRSSLVATLGVVASFQIFLVWPGMRRTGLYLVPALLCGLAKPLTVMFAPLLLVFLLFFEEDLSLGEILRPGNFLRVGSAALRSVPAFVTGVLLFVFLSVMESDSLEYADVDRWTYLISQPFVWLHYFRLFVVPRGLTADCDWEFLKSWQDPRLFLGALFILGLAAAIWLLARWRSSRPAAFGLAWFAIALLPTSSIFPLSEVYNEHRVFFPYVGLALAFAWSAGSGLHRLARRGTGARRAAIVAASVLAAGIVSAHGVGTHVRNRVWKDDLTLWRDVATKSPRNGRGLMNYGLALMTRGRLAEALTYYERAKLLNPNYSILEINLGIVKSALGDQESAEPHFRRALQLTPGYAKGHYYYARWLVDRGRGAEALEHLERAVEISAGDVDAGVMLMNLHAAMGNVSALDAQVARLLGLAPDHPAALAYRNGSIPFRPPEETVEAYMRLGFAYTKSESWIEAAVVFRHTLGLEPDSAAAWNNLGWALAGLGFFERSVPCFEKAAELDPEMELAANNLRWARGKLAGQPPP